VENGADAVYFGMVSEEGSFNARARAANFHVDELPSVLGYLHDRGAKGFVTINVLTFDSELPALEQQVRQCAAAGVDAVIVQVRSWIEAAGCPGGAASASPGLCLKLPYKCLYIVLNLLCALCIHGRRTGGQWS
jgi:hypothetical protein